VGVVPAGVHDTHLAPQVGGADRRGEGEPGRLDDGQGVHVGAQRHHGAGVAAAQHPHHPGVGDLPPHLEPQGLEALRHQARGPELAVGELGMLVEVASPGDHALLGGPGRGVDGLAQLLAAGRGRDQEQQGEGASEPHVCLLATGRWAGESTRVR
jgi:hypothetical protein